MFIGYTKSSPVIEGTYAEQDAMRLYRAGCDMVYSSESAYDWADMCKNMQPGDTLVMIRQEDVPEIIDFDTLVIVLDMIANSAVMLLDDADNLHRVTPKVKYGRITTDDI